MSVQVNSLKDGWTLPQLANRQLMAKAWEICKQAAKMWNRKPSEFVFSICIDMARKGEKLVNIAKKQAFIAKYKDKNLVITGNTYHNRAVLNSCKLIYAHRQWSGIINCEQQLTQLYLCKGLEIAIVDECAKKQAFIAKYKDKNLVITGNTYHNRAVLNSCKLIYAHRQWSGIINCEQQLMQLYFCKGLEIAIVDECYIARSAIKNSHIEG